MRGAADTMDDITNDSLKETLKSFDIVMNFEKMLPTDLLKSIDHIQDVAKSEEVPDGGLSAVVMSIACGKILVESAKKHAERVSKDFEAVEQATAEIEGTLELAKCVDKGEPFPKPADALQTIHEAIIAYDKVADGENNKDDVSIKFMESAKDALNKVVPAMGKAFIKSEFWTSMKLIESSLKTNAFEGLKEATFVIDHHHVDAVLCRQSMLKGNLQTLKCAKKMSLLMRDALSVCNDLSKNVNTTVRIVKLIKMFDAFASEFYDIVDADTSDLIGSIFNLFSQIGYDKISNDASEHAVNIGHLMTKAGVLKKQ